MNCFRCNAIIETDKAGWVKCNKCEYSMFIPKGSKAVKVEKKEEKEDK
jgi:DNA-directed RNA polymerase subunit RPC12/RpoP